MAAVRSQNDHLGHNEEGDTMKTLLNNPNESSRSEISGATPEMLVRLGEGLRNTTIINVHPGDRLTLGERLIAIYDTPYVGLPEIRCRAARACAKLASWDDRILEAVLENAKLYAMSQHLQDAYPYSPNSFDVLAEVGPIYDRVTSFLRDVVERDWGIARAAAARTLEAIENRLRLEHVSGQSLKTWMESRTTGSAAIASATCRDKCVSAPF